MSESMRPAMHPLMCQSMMGQSMRASHRGLIREGLSVGSRATVALTVILVVALAVATPVGAVEEHPTCRPSAEVAELVKSLSWSDTCEPSEACGGELIARAKEALAKHPDSVHLHRAYQILVQNWQHAEAEDAREALRERYEQRLAAQPDAAFSHYLVGRLATREPEVGVASMERAVALDPGFPWGHLGRLTMLLSIDRKAHREAVQESFEAFETACPHNVDQLRHARRFDAPEFWRARLPRLRQVLADTEEIRDLFSYRWLWALDFSLTDLDDHASVRARVRADLDHLASLDLHDEELWWSLREHGTEMLDDPAALKALQTAAAEQFPCSAMTVSTLLAPWQQQPTGEDDLRWAQQVVAESDAWIEQCPLDFRIGLTRLLSVRTLVLAEGQLSTDQLLQEVERALTMWEANRSKVRIGRSPYYHAAAMLLERRLDPARVGELIALEADYDAEAAGQLSGMPEGALQRFELGQRSKALELDGLRLRRAVLEKDFEGARRQLVELDAGVTTLRQESDDHARWMTAAEARLLHLRGRLAEEEERWLDALLLYRRSQARADLPELFGAVDQKVEVLWRQLGGTDEGRQALEKSADQGLAIVAPSGWQNHDSLAPEFELADLEGKTWRRDDLLGTTTLINFWATWCAPCRVELPYVQTLAEQLVERPELRVITFNLDDNPGLVQPFLEREQLQLPVLLGDLSALELEGLPTNWIVDAQGTIRRSQTGFSVDKADRWVDDALTALLEVAAGTPGDASSGTEGP